MHYSVHDGPGIRSTVFFKGCPLSCKWCHNPESINPEPQDVFEAGKCVKCGLCDNGGKCPSGARETIGYEITVSDLMKEISKYRIFYDQSGGGVTFSGGEPFLQADFLLEILEKCRDEYIKSAIDTSGFCDSSAILAAAGITGYFLYDVKFMNSEKHEKYCGAPNSLILENLALLSETKTKILLRIPVIPSVNDDLQEMRGIFNFVRDFKNIEFVHLLPYHAIQTHKYNKIGQQYEFANIREESPNMEKIHRLFGEKFRVKTGG